MNEVWSTKGGGVRKEVVIKEGKEGKLKEREGVVLGYRRRGGG